MDLANLNLADVVLILLLIGAFVIGFIQGVIRQLLGLAVWLVSFLLAANLEIPVGTFLGGYWSSFSLAYSQMLAFLILYVVFLVIGNIIVFVMYKRSAMEGRLAVVDEVVGAILGVGLAILIIGGFIAILDSFYAYQQVSNTAEQSIIREIYQALASSSVATWFRGSLVPALGAILGGLVPAELRPYL